MSVRTKDLKTITKVLSSSTSYSVGGQVPAGMKRFVTFVQLDAVVSGGASQVGIYLASVGVSNPTRASIIATGNRKILAYLRATQASGARRSPLCIPKIPDSDAPLFSIAGEHWIGAIATKTTGVLSMQYFDE